MKQALSKGQILYLNVLRSVAANIVLVDHILWLASKNTKHNQGAMHIIFSSTTGVSLFFLISGFLITFSVITKIDSNKNYVFLDYFIDRFARIFTAYMPALFFIAALDFAVRDCLFYLGENPTKLNFSDRYDIMQFIYNSLMLQDFPVFRILVRLGFSSQSWFPRPFGSGGPLWTICIEWWIYMFF